MPVTGDFLTHLAGGHTTICRAWQLTRQDGAVFGFTDHDRDLAFGGTVFRAGTGLSADALSQTTGLAVDNSEASGVLSDSAVSEAELHAGLFDGAAVTSWIVNWTDPTQRAVQFRGSLGELRMEAGAFRAELRGLTEALNRSQGRLFQRGCSARLGDGHCGIDVTGPDYSVETAIAAMTGRSRLQLPPLGRYADHWFEQGRLEVLDGAAAGLSGHVKSDRSGPARLVELWQEIRGGLAAGDRVRLVAGCDKRAETCRVKFANFLNFRGFPHVPGEDWLMSYPARSGGNDGGSRYR
ncbi:DUF2163 domain-containing protein [Mangrovicoccus algicola]|uniref:DUF2163 domain-containing protein n=1 Tax=Mangrovicoccus algicola TaxID=2771008 RepID=A0A8J6ZBT2_9RHOB|nr:DUF2163 domain-containing protein [Mangrovicoccus algicola]MBE3639731.1 DUF2163 domain-containing protein [Mangrovicoccus algicola]